MTARLVTVEDFREWSGAGSSSSSDELIQQCLDEAEAGIAADVGVRSIDEIVTVLEANAVARGDEMRRAANFLARRNSPEGIAGAGDDGVIAVPAGDPGSASATRRIRRILGIAAGGSVVAA